MKTKKTTSKPVPSDLELYKKIKEKVYKKRFQNIVRIEVESLFNNIKINLERNMVINNLTKGKKLLRGD